MLMLETLHRVESLICSGDPASHDFIGPLFDTADFNSVVIQCDSIIERCCTDGMLDTRSLENDVALLRYVLGRSKRDVCREIYAVREDLFYDAFLSFVVHLFDLDAAVVHNQDLAGYFRDGVSDILSLDEVALVAICGLNNFRDDDRVRRLDLYKKCMRVLVPRSLEFESGESQFKWLCSSADTILPSVSAPFFINYFYSALASYVKNRLRDVALDFSSAGIKGVDQLRLIKGVYGMYGVVCSALGPWFFLKTNMESDESRKDSRSVFVDQALKLVIYLSEQCILDGCAECGFIMGDTDFQSQNNLLTCICGKADVNVCNKYGFVDRTKFISALICFVSRLFEFLEFEVSEFELSGFAAGSFQARDVLSLDDVGMWALGSGDSRVSGGGMRGKMFVYRLSMKIVEDMIIHRKTHPKRTEDEEVRVICENWLWVMNDVVGFRIYKNNFISAVISLAFFKLNIFGYDLGRIKLAGIGQLRAVNGITYYYDILEWAFNPHGSSEGRDDLVENICKECIEAFKTYPKDGVTLGKLCNYVHYVMKWHHIDIQFPDDFYSALVSFFLLGYRSGGQIPAFTMDRKNVAIRRLGDIRSYSGIVRRVYLPYIEQSASHGDRVLIAPLPSSAR